MLEQIKSKLTVVEMWMEQVLLNPYICSTELGINIFYFNWHEKGIGLSTDAVAR